MKTFNITNTHALMCHWRPNSSGYVLLPRRVLWDRPCNFILCRTKCILLPEPTSLAPFGGSRGSGFASLILAPGNPKRKLQARRADRKRGARICRPCGARSPFMTDPGAAGSLRSPSPLATFDRAFGAQARWAPSLRSSTRANLSPLRGSLAFYDGSRGSGFASLTLAPGYLRSRLRRSSALGPAPSALFREGISAEEVFA